MRTPMTGGVVKVRLPVRSPHLAMAVILAIDNLAICCSVSGRAGERQAKREPILWRCGVSRQLWKRFSGRHEACGVLHTPCKE